MGSHSTYTVLKKFAPSKGCSTCQIHLLSLNIYKQPTEKEIIILKKQKQKTKNSSKPQTVLPTLSWPSAGGHLEMPAGSSQVLMACSDPWIHSTRTALWHFCLATISESQTYAQKDKTKAWKRAQVMQRDEHEAKASQLDNLGIFVSWIGMDLVAQNCFFTAVRQQDFISQYSLHRCFRETISTTAPKKKKTWETISENRRGTWM